MKEEMNWGMMILSIVLMTLGIYFLVWGFIAQTGSNVTLDIYAMLYYLIGVVLFGLGKKFKHKGMGMDMMMHKGR